MIPATWVCTTTGVPPLVTEVAVYHLAGGVVAAGPLVWPVAVDAPMLEIPHRCRPSMRLAPPWSEVTRYLLPVLARRVLVVHDECRLEVLRWHLPDWEPDRPHRRLPLPNDAERGFRQLKDPKLVSFSPLWHWTDQKIRVHVSYCVTALALAHLMRRQATHAGLPMSVRELLAHLASIQETMLLYPSTGGRPRARRMLTQMTPTQQQLYDLFGLDRYAPTPRPA